jgi:hypothetical protein
MGKERSSQLEASRDFRYIDFALRLRRYLGRIATYTHSNVINIYQSTKICLNLKMQSEENKAGTWLALATR